MKGYSIVLAAIVLLSCNNTRVMSAGSSYNQYARTEQVTDSFLHALQQQNELVLAFAVETYAWGRTVNYRILTMNNNQWKGYTSYKTLTGNATQKTESVAVSDEVCNSLWKFIQEKEAWKIKGDTGKNFCGENAVKKCTINDGVTWRILLLTKDKVTDPAYYEPAFYEECCPGNEERKLFIQVADKIKAATPVKEDEE